MLNTSAAQISRQYLVQECGSCGLHYVILEFTMIWTLRTWERVSRDGTWKKTFNSSSFCFWLAVKNQSLFNILSDQLSSLFCSLSLKPTLLDSIGCSFSPLFLILDNFEVISLHPQSSISWLYIATNHQLTKLTNLWSDCYIQLLFTPCYFLA